MSCRFKPSQIFSFALYEARNAAEAAVLYATHSMKVLRSSAALALSITFAATFASCQGCHTTRSGGSTAADASTAIPTLRIVALSSVAGALEPCGCTKDQLGGVDHLAALLRSTLTSAPERMVLSVGPLFFSDPTSRADRVDQDRWKADAIAGAARAIGLSAWTPGSNDLALGASELARLRDLSGAPLLAANLSPLPDSAGFAPSLVREVGELKVALIGLTAARFPESQATSNVDAPALALSKQLDMARKQGAQVTIVLAAIARGEALRLADAYPDIDLLLVGKTDERGPANDAAKPPTMIGSTLVVETPNHLQAVALIDLFVSDTSKGDVKLADGGGIQRVEEVLSLSNRIRDLEHRINSAEREPSTRADDIAARKADLAKLREQKAALEKVSSPVAGNYFRYRLVEVRDGLGSDAAVREQMLAYYKRVNDNNKVAFRDRKPPEASPRQPTFVGVEACTTCHDEPRKVWDKTPHAGAYGTLQREFKEFNLDCVSCHVTGYGKPAGSTVTWNDKLQNVQCEECHGPGSLHAKKPNDKRLIIAKPSPESCVSSCHHSPHVEGFDAQAKMKLVLGPGHGE